VPVPRSSPHRSRAAGRRSGAGCVWSAELCGHHKGYDGGHHKGYGEHNGYGDGDDDKGDDGRDDRKGYGDGDDHNGGY
jgi:hypothetical protein